MASITFDEEVFCSHLSKFYDSWKAVSLLARPHIYLKCSHYILRQAEAGHMYRVPRSSQGVLLYGFGLLC